MTDEEASPISITLSPSQVDDVVRAAAGSRAPSISTLIADRLNKPFEREDAGTPPSRSGAVEEKPLSWSYLPMDTVDSRLSRSLLRGLSILTAFGPDGGARGIVELARDLGMSPSTAHRYALTLVELGLLERCPRTRKYRLPRN
jgi:hypothetical protein